MRRWRIMLGVLSILMVSAVSWGATLEERVTDLEGRVTVVEPKVEHTCNPNQPGLPGVACRVEILEGEVFGQGGTNSRLSVLEQQMTQLQPILDLVSNCSVSVSTATLNGLSGPHFILSNCNFHIRSGGGSTGAAVNGKGNLIIGYNEEPASPPTGYRNGSHSLVLGPEHTYSSYGGFVAGFRNTVSGIYASVSGGAANKASGARASVSGGLANEASNVESSVSGGQVNTASGQQASICGGDQNVASGVRATVCGGNSNQATGQNAAVSGGGANVASGGGASINGGSFNAASATYSTVSGGTYRTENGANYWRGGSLQGNP